MWEVSPDDDDAVGATNAVKLLHYERTIMLHHASLCTCTRCRCRPPFGASVDQVKTVFPARQAAPDRGPPSRHAEAVIFKLDQVGEVYVEALQHRL